MNRPAGGRAGEVRLILDLYVVEVLDLAGWRLGLRTAKAVFLVLTGCALVTLYAGTVLVLRLAVQDGADPLLRSTLAVACLGSLAYLYVLAAFREIATRRRTVISDFRHRAPFRAWDLGMLEAFIVHVALSLVLRTAFVEAMMLAAVQVLAPSPALSVALVAGPGILCLAVVTLAAHRALSRDRKRPGGRAVIGWGVVSFALGVAAGSALGSVRPSGTTLRPLVTMDDAHVGIAALGVLGVVLAGGGLLVPLSRQLAERRFAHPDLPAEAGADAPARSLADDDGPFTRAWLVRTVRGDNRLQIIVSVWMLAWVVTASVAGLRLGLGRPPLGHLPGTPARLLLLFPTFVAGLAVSEIATVILDPGNVRRRVRLVWEFGGDSWRLAGRIVAVQFLLVLPLAVLSALCGFLAIHETSASPASLAGLAHLAGLATSCAAAGVIAGFGFTGARAADRQPETSFVAALVGLGLTLPALVLGRQAGVAAAAYGVGYALILLGGATWTVETSARRIGSMVSD